MVALDLDPGIQVGTVLEDSMVHLQITAMEAVEAEAEEAAVLEVIALARLIMVPVDLPMEEMVEKEAVRFLLMLVCQDLVEVAVEAVAAVFLSQTLLHREQVMQEAAAAAAAMLILPTIY